VNLKIFFSRLSHAENLPLPGYAHEGDAGADLCAAVPEDEPLIIQPGDRALVPTGLCVCLPPGHEWQLRPRSGLAAKNGITILNAPATIDCGYRGEVKVVLLNTSKTAFTVKRGMRIAQAVLCPIFSADFEEVSTLPDAARGAGGFGSTGA